MPPSYLSVPWASTPVQEGDLRIRKSAELTAAVRRLPYIRLLGLLRCQPDGQEAVILDVEAEIGQTVVHDIRTVERIAVVFDPDDEKSPEVLALRDDFPSVPHQNLRPFEKPRSLCLFDVPYDDFRIRLTPVMLLQMIRRWLSDTARGQLHAPDQPLEPLLSSSESDFIVLPPDIDTITSENDIIAIRGRPWRDSKVTWFAERRSSASLETTHIDCMALALKGEPQPHGIIHRQPQNLLELHSFLAAAKIDLLGELRRKLRDLRLRGVLDSKLASKDRKLLDAMLVLVVVLPKTRTGGGPTESSDYLVFLLPRAIKDIGVLIGIWEVRGNTLAELIRFDESRRGEEIGVCTLNPVLCLTRNSASELNGLSESDMTRICLVGTGALGSQMFINLARMGFGEWYLVDQDCMLPHNLARHAIPGHCGVGFAKSVVLASQANDLVVQAHPFARAIAADVLHPGKSASDLSSALSEAKVVIDASTSIAVARSLSNDCRTSARLISVFLSPTARDLVVLAEDSAKNTRLDSLEMQYYRGLLEESSLGDHLKRNDAEIRYARSCRDVASRIPQDLVALHAAIASRAIREILAGTSASITIWRADTAILAVNRVALPVRDTVKYEIGPWTLYSDESLLVKVRASRSARLPSETGGVLIGSFDVQRRIVYVVDTISSPPDSVEWPTSYIRGCKGLKEQVHTVQDTTARMLDYVGEWHSHPSDANPSGDDKKAFSWLTDIMGVDGLPGLMLIVGSTECQWFLGTM